MKSAAGVRSEPGRPPDVPVTRWARSASRSRRRSSESSKKGSLAVRPVPLSASTVPAGGNGTSDQGLDNVVGSTQFRVTLRILEGASDFTLFVDSSYQGDLVNVNSTTTAEIAGQSFLIVVPEPGTAILLGVGLAGLAGFGRKSTAGRRSPAPHLDGPRTQTS